MVRKNRRLYALLLLIFLAITAPAALYIYYFLFPGYVATRAADGFFGALRDNDLKAAFRHVAYFDTNSDVRPYISYKDAETRWVTRVGNLKKQGIYLKSYSDIKTWTDDAYPVGDVNVTIVEDGRAKTYRASIHFSRLHGKMKIQAIYPPSFNGALDGYEGAISGNLVSEESARDGKTPIGDKAPITPEKGAEIAKSFAGAESVNLVDSPVQQGQPLTFEFKTDDNRVVWVDAKAGIATRIKGPLKTSPLKPKELPLTKDVAIHRAASFVKRHYPWFDELTLDEAQSGPNLTYELKWRLIDENGVWLPMWVMVSIDRKTGVLAGYTAQAEDTTISTKAKTTKAEAIELANLSTDDTLESCKLNLVRDKSGNQRLVWVVTYINRTKFTGDVYAIGGSTVHIDAHTGAEISAEVY